MTEKLLGIVVEFAAVYMAGLLFGLGALHRHAVRGHGRRTGEEVSDWESAEREGQRELALRLAAKGIPVSVIAKRCRSIGPSVSADRVRKWIERARA